MAVWKVVSATALMWVASAHLLAAQKTAVPDGTAYAFSTPASGACPSLQFHVVLGADSSLHGVIGWNHMASIARTTGMLHGSKFEATAKEEGGEGRTFTISGEIGGNNWMTVTIVGPHVTCKDMPVPVLWQPFKQG